MANNGLTHSGVQRQLEV